MTELRALIAEALWKQYASGLWHLASCSHIPKEFGELGEGERSYWYRYADVLLALPGVAVVELPDADDPDTWEYSGGTHSWTVPNGDDCSEDEQVFTSRHGDVEIGLDRYTPDDARQLAAALLAAANAAEAQS